MHHGKAHGQHLFRFEQVAQIGAGISPADRAVALRVDRLLIALILLIFDIDHARPREQVSVAAVACRHDTVEKVHAARDGFDDVPRCADAHQVARLVGRHIGLDGGNGIIHLLCRLPHREAADRITGQIEVCDLLHMLNAQIVKNGALIDAEEHLAGIDSIEQKSITKGGMRLKKSYKKYELVSSHTARRSFATNLYLSGFPTLSIMQITGHRTETAFMKYIKVTANQHASLLRKHWQTKAN